MVVYDTPVNISGFADFMSYTNGVTEGYFGGLILFALGIVLFIIFKNVEDSDTTIFVISVVVFIMAVLMWIPRWINLMVFLFALAFLIVGTFKKVVSSFSGNL